MTGSFNLLEGGYLLKSSFKSLPAVELNSPKFWNVSDDPFAVTARWPKCPSAFLSLWHQIVRPSEISLKSLVSEFIQVSVISRCSLSVVLAFHMDFPALLQKEASPWGWNGSKMKNDKMSNSRSAVICWLCWWASCSVNMLLSPEWFIKTGTANH